MKTVSNSNGRIAGVFKLKGVVLGTQKASSELAIVLDHANNCKVMDPEGIRAVSLDYCKTLLENRAPAKSYEDNILYKNDVHDIRCMKRCLMILKN